MFVIKSAFELGTLLFANREGRSHHICNIVSLSIVSVQSTSFKRIVYVSELLKISLEETTAACGW
jgi:hypothetical protein